MYPENFIQDRVSVTSVERAAAGPMPPAAAASEMHPRVRAIVEHWAGMGPPGRLPGRQHLDPAAIPRLLPNIWLLDIEGSAPLRFRYRLAGTRIARAIGADPTGRYLDETHDGPGYDRVFAYLCEVARTGNPSWRSGTPAFGELHDLRRVERVYLPLAADGRAVDMILAFSIFLDRLGMEF